MAEYGCCTLSICVYADSVENDEISCDKCSFYNKYFFKEKELEEDLQMEMNERQIQL